MVENSATVAILGGGTEASMTTILLRKAPMEEQNKHAMIRVANLTTIAAGTESVVAVVMSNVV